LYTCPIAPTRSAPAARSTRCPRAQSSVAHTAAAATRARTRDAHPPAPTSADPRRIPARHSLRIRPSVLREMSSFISAMIKLISFPGLIAGCVSPRLPRLRILDASNFFSIPILFAFDISPVRSSSSYVELNEARLH
jgi:hypothetical protein